MRACNVIIMWHDVDGKLNGGDRTTKPIYVLRKHHLGFVDWAPHTCVMWCEVYPIRSLNMKSKGEYNAIVERELQNSNATTVHFCFCSTFQSKCVVTVSLLWLRCLQQSISIMFCRYRFDFSNSLFIVLLDGFPSMCVDTISDAVGCGSGRNRSDGA